MRLEYKKKYTSGDVTVLLNLVDITSLEQEAMQAVGVPNLVLSKVYPKTKTRVDINIPILNIDKLRTEFKTSFKMALTDYTDSDTFINDVKNILKEEKETLLRKYDEYLNGKSPEEDYGYPFCCKDDGHVHIFSGEELTDEIISKMEDGEIFVLVEDDKEEE